MAGTRTALVSGYATLRRDKPRLSWAIFRSSLRDFGLTRHARLKLARTNIKEAITGYLASLEKHNEPVPLPIAEEVEG